MAYITRSLEKSVTQISEDYSCLLLIGPRQVGKTTMLEHLMEGTARQKVTLDDMENRRLAKSDPALFLELHPAPVLIDEVQYAPELFPYIKIQVDQGAAPGAYWLTSSQAFHLMDLAQESLAGRVAILHMSSLSQSELYGDGCARPLSLSMEELSERNTHLGRCSSAEMFERIWNGGLPGHRSGRYRDRDGFYSSYIQTYIQRDVSDMIPGVDRLRFADFIRAAACRVGQMLNVHDIAQDVGVSDDTAKRWLRVLEQSGVIFYLRPYANHLLRRTVRTPKMYFFDTGLVAYLTKYSSPDILMNGALNGAILENYTVAEIRKTWHNSAKECLMHYYRDKDTNEIDMVIEADGELHPLEIRKSKSPGTELASAFRILDKGSSPRGTGAVLCLREEMSAIDRSTFILPIWMI
ncbi:MAG: ATP-binding protein [Clostridia bacterium]|nr:ATP-binding protein [Clostridia bacterium]